MKEQFWLMPTNVQNLTQMLAAGLIMDATGYQGDTYYKDITSDVPFSTLLFANNIPAQYFSETYLENSNVLPAILALDIQDIKESIISQNDIKCIVKLPLPISCIKKILLPDKSVKNLFDAQFINFDNLPRLKIKVEVSKEYFTASSGTQSLFFQNNANNIIPTLAQPDYPKAQWFGGALLTFYTLSNRDNYFLDIYRKMSQPTSQAVLPQDDIVGNSIDCIIAAKRPEDTRLAFFYDVLQKILAQRARYTGKLLTENIMGYIEHYQTEDLSIIEFIGQLQKIADTRLSDIFKTAKGPISRSLLLFFLRDTIDELLDFETKNPKIELSPADLCLATLLFSARTGYVSLKFACKSVKPLSDFVAAAMSWLALANTGVINATPFLPPRYFLSSEEKFEANELYAKELAKQLRWPSGAYKLNILRLPKDYASKIRQDEKSPFFILQNNQNVIPFSIPLLKDTKCDYTKFMQLLATTKEIPAIIDENSRKRLRA